MISEAEQKSDLHQLRVKLLNDGVNEYISVTEKLKNKYQRELKRRKNILLSRRV